MCRVDAKSCGNSEKGDVDGEGVSMHSLLFPWFAPTRILIAQRGALHWHSAGTDTAHRKTKQQPHLKRMH